MPAETNPYGSVATAPSENGHVSTEFLEIGSSGLAQYHGYVVEEFLRSLQGRDGAAVFREMRDNDPVIGAILHTVEMLMRNCTWTVEPKDESPLAVEYAEFAGTCLNDMTTSWEDTISQILSMLVYGWSYHEIVYKERKGFTDDPMTRSAYDDGRIGWRKLAPRSQDTLLRWKFGDDSGIDGLYQLDIYSQKGEVFLPIEKCLLFRTSARKGDPEGRSILRNAYVPWYYKRRISEIEAIGIERDLAGLPVAFVPPQLLSDNATSQETAALNEIKKIVRNIKRDEQEGLVYPLAYDPDTGNLAYDIKLLTTGGDRQFDTNQIISRYEQRIAMTVLADFILLGHEQVGTQALSVSKIGLFTDSLNSWLTGITEVFTKHAFPRLMRLNGWDESLSPELKHLPLSNVDIGAIGQYLLNLSNAGAAVFPDEDLEAYLRELAGLPTRAETEQI
jgi:hypothetical protein